MNKNQMVDMRKRLVNKTTKIGIDQLNDFGALKSEKYPDLVEDDFSPWYYFFSQGCGWCKKTTSIVEELIKEGHDILVLDLVETDNQQLRRELEQEYKVKCGTPWFINEETGKGFCGSRDKDVIKKWLNGEDIPELPKPQTEPPKPPMGPEVTNKKIDKWGKDMKVWQEENKDFPNLQPIDDLVRTIKTRRDKLKEITSPQNIVTRLLNLETKLNKLMTHLGVK